jgi:hypothetical protein
LLKSAAKGDRAIVCRRRSDLKAPLRSFYCKVDDLALFHIVVGYLRVVDQMFWGEGAVGTYLKKTVGFQALFDLLYVALSTVLHAEVAEGDSSGLAIAVERYFANAFVAAQAIDFSDNFFQASGIGRSRIRGVIGVAIGLIQPAEVSQEIRSFVSARPPLQR